MYLGLKTRLAGVQHGDDGFRVVYRGADVEGLIRGSTFTSVVFHHCVGRFPTPAEERVTDAILVAGLDHHFLSALPARIVISRAPESFQGAVAAGIMSIGSRRGAAAGDAANMLQTAVAQHAGLDADKLAAEVVDELVGARRRIPGIGNPVHKVSDPRAQGVLEVAEGVGVAGIHVATMRRIAALASERTGRSLVINYSGSVGAAVSDMGWDWRIANGLVLLARTGGLIAHVFEEILDPTYEAFSEEVAAHNDSIYEGD